MLLRSDWNLLSFFVQVGREGTEYDEKGFSARVDLEIVKTWYFEVRQPAFFRSSILLAVNGSKSLQSQNEKMFYGNN